MSLVPRDVAGWDTGTMPDSATHDERLWPGPLGWSLTPALGVVVLIALFPAVPELAWVVGLVAAVLAVGATVALSPRVRVADGELVAGRARIPVALLGEAEVLDRDGVHRVLGPGSDARTYAVLRSWLPGVLVPVLDPQDPTPAWLISSRRPAALAAAITAQRQAAHSEQIG